MREKKGGVQPPLTYTPPRLNQAVLGGLRLLAPVYLRRLLGIRFGRIEGAEHLVEAYRRFQEGADRTIIAFRHVNPDDAHVMFTLLNNRLPAEARRRELPLHSRPHAHFLYGRGVPLWKGKWLTWLFSRLGAVPVPRDELVRANMETIWTLLTEGRYPLAMAPEAQVTYHNGLVYPLEPGFAQFALWALRALPEEQGEGDARIVPVALHYRYGREPEGTFRRIIAAVEERAGFRTPERLRGGEVSALLRFAGGTVLDRCEDFYRGSYGMTMSGMEGSAEEPGEFTRRRVEAVTDTVLRLQEERLGIRSPKEGFLSRIFAVKQAAWARIFRRGPEYGRVPLRDALKDYIADEARMLLRHLEVADVMSYLQPEYGLGSGDLNRVVETALSLHDLLGRLMGGTIADRIRLKPTTVHVRIGEAVSLRGARGGTAESSRTLRDRVIERTRRSLERLSRDDEL